MSGSEVRNARRREFTQSGNSGSKPEFCDELAFHNSAVLCNMGLHFSALVIWVGFVLQKGWVGYRFFLERKL